MNFTLQKAPFLKRTVAFIFDSIILIIVAVGSGCLFAYLTGYNSYSDAYSAKVDDYQAEYNISFDTTEEKYNSMSTEEKASWDTAYEAFISDSETIFLFNKTMNLTIGITATALLLGFVVVELVIPIIFKNGQTLGKKVFNLAVISLNGVKIKPVQVFTRTVLGKFAVETMVPVYFFFMFFMFNRVSTLGFLLVISLIVLQAVFFFTAGKRRFLHDVLAQTVVVDYSQQIIYENYDELLQAKEEYAEAEAQKSVY